MLIRYDAARSGFALTDLMLTATIANIRHSSIKLL